jgi:hypothetical protein
MSEEIRHHPGSSEDFTFRLIMVLLIFVPLGFVGRLLTYYFVGGSSFASSVYAIVGTLLSVIIFFSLGYYLRISKALAVGFLINTASLLCLNLFLWVPRSLTIKYSDGFLFLDGHVTGYGIAYYFPLALWESAVSCLDFVVYSRLSKRFTGGLR